MIGNKRKKFVDIRSKEEVFRKSHWKINSSK